MLYDCSEGLPKTDYNIGKGQGGREWGGNGWNNDVLQKNGA